MINLRKNYREYSKSKDRYFCGLKILALLEGFSKILFYLFDHQVVLSDIGVTSKEKTAIYQPKSLKMYMLQNIFGAVKCLIEMLILIQRGGIGVGMKEEEDMEKGEKLMRSKSIELLRNILDVVVACYYINKPANAAARVGIVGILTSLIGIAQSLELI